MEENKLIQQSSIIQQDGWSSLRSFTAARIALGRTGVSIPIKENLQFRLAHAYARDAVYACLSTEMLLSELDENRWNHICLNSECANRNEYLQRPDKGRKLNCQSREQLCKHNNECYDIAIIAADGLSAIAINEHFIPLMKILIPFLKDKFSIAPITLVEQARVAIADEVGSLLKAQMSIVFIGERPGLTSPNSMGAYITYNPTVGLTDERRNCVSNIRPEGLPYLEAVEKIMYLVTTAFQLKLSGVALKDETLLG